VGSELERRKEVIVVDITLGGGEGGDGNDLRSPTGGKRKKEEVSASKKDQESEKR